MGQSDRDFVENGNTTPSIPQALALMNGDMAAKAGPLARHSPLMRFIRSSSDQADAAFLALLSRHPTDEERRVWVEASGNGKADLSDLIHSLLNTKKFLFIQ
jgi:hypothetical protein